MAKRTVRKAAVDSETSTELVAVATIPPRSKVLVFISHDSRDSDFAEAFANLLSDVSAGTLKSFRSSDKKGNAGIEFGAEWYVAIMSQLSDATDVVALLTSQSIDRPWILYEAGVAKGKLETTVFGVALGVPLEKVSTGPFGQFQNCGDDEDSLTKLVMQLLARNPEASPREEAIRTQVRVFREQVDKLLKTKGNKTPQVPAEEQSVAKLFEEVKAMVRELPEQVDERVRFVSRGGPFRRLRRFHPRMLEDLLFQPVSSDLEDSPAIGWMIFVSMLRDDIPWLYEPGMELYRALRSGNEAAVNKARQELLAIAKMTSRGPLFHEMIADDKESFFIFRHLDEFIERLVMRYPISRIKTPSRQSRALKK